MLYSFVFHCDFSNPNRITKIGLSGNLRGRFFIICPVININKSDSYSFSNDETGVEGRYEGELGYGNNWTKFANGWGVFSWDTMESSMGTFKNDYLQEGLLIESDGTQYFGTFKDGRLDKVTEKRDVIGNPISR